MERLYTPVELAKMFGTSSEAVRGYIRNGTLQATDSGCKRDKYLISQSSLDDFLDKHPKYKSIGHDEEKDIKIVFSTKEVEAAKLILDAKLSIIECSNTNLELFKETLIKIAESL